jgi:hypothetical protein
MQAIDINRIVIILAPIQTGDSTITHDQFIAPKSFSKINTIHKNGANPSLDAITIILFALASKQMKPWQMTQFCLE